MEESPRQKRRRERLQEIVDSLSNGQTELAMLTGTPKSHISAILAGRRGIGDRLAAKFARAHGKGPDWMDLPADLEVTDEERRFLLALRASRSQGEDGSHPQNVAQLDTDRSHAGKSGLMQTKAQKERARQHHSSTRRKGNE